MSDVLVVGCGLLGTSVGLALQGSDHADVTLSDANPRHEAAAVARGAGRAWDGTEQAGLVVVAVPPVAVAAVLIDLQRRNIGQIYTHLSSVQSQVQDEIEALSPDPSRVVGGHPLAGRELTGPEAALADLFVGRPWALCAGPHSAPDAVDGVRMLALTCAAVPVQVDPDTHDRAVALLSHLPQVVSTALAALLVTPQAEQAVPELPVVLAGPGLVDTTRLAAGDPGLWTDILTANARHVAPLVAALATLLSEVAQALSTVAAGPDPAATQVVQDLLRRGNAGRATVPVKRGELAGAFDRVRVVLPDRPGQLALLLQAAGEAQVNVEDVRVEHVPGRRTGVIDLLVGADESDHLARVLSAAGWQVS
jgi:prephenate dehydrogenase